MRLAPEDPEDLRVIARFQELTTNEKAQIMTWVDWCIAHLERSLDPKPDGFNVGLNDGAAAGQTVGQLHVHIIPRFQGDVPTRAAGSGGYCQPRLAIGQAKSPWTEGKSMMERGFIWTPEIQFL